MRRVWVGRGFVLAVVLVMLGSVGGVRGQQVSEADILNAIRFRIDFGLRADREYVEQTVRDPAAFPDATWGVPLSPEEAAEMSRRGALPDQLRAAREYAAAQPDNAGYFIDHHRGGVPVFSFTGHADSHRAMLEDLVPAAVTFDVLAARYSRAELDAKQDVVDSDTPMLRSAGLHIATTGIDTVTNTVSIGVIALTPAIEALLRHRYGDIISVRSEGPIVPDSCISRANCGDPMKAGLRLKSNATGALCTSGFIGRMIGTTNFRVITAGHCIEKYGGGLNVTWLHGGNAIGPALKETWYAYTDADVGLIRLTESGDKNRFYTSGPSDVRSLTSGRSLPNQSIGDTLCRGGITTGYMCGQITLEDVTRDVDGHPVRHSWEVSFDASPGDSGGPYFFGSAGFGIHTDSTDNNYSGTKRAWYSPIYWITMESGVAVCYSATC